MEKSTRILLSFLNRDDDNQFFGRSSSGSTDSSLMVQKHQAPSLFEDAAVGVPLIVIFNQKWSSFSLLEYFESNTHTQHFHLVDAFFHLGMDRFIQSTAKFCWLCNIM